MRRLARSRGIDAQPDAFGGVAALRGAWGLPDPGLSSGHPQQQGVHVRFGSQMHGRPNQPALGFGQAQRPGMCGVDQRICHDRVELAEPLQQERQRRVVVRILQRP